MEARVTTWIFLNNMILKKIDHNLSSSANPIYPTFVSIIVTAFLSLEGTN